MRAVPFTSKWDSIRVLNFAKAALFRFGTPTEENSSVIGLNRAAPATNQVTNRENSNAFRAASIAVRNIKGKFERFLSLRM